MLLGGGWISVSLGAAAGGFALTATHFSRRRKVSKRLGPGVRPARWGSGFLRSGIDPGAAPTVCFAAPPLAVFGFAKRSLRSHPRINPSTQPAEGASTARSRAAAELTLILLSGEKHKRCAICAVLLWLFCGSELAREGGLTADQFLPDVLVPTVGASLLAKAACQPTNFCQMYSFQLWERACSRRRPDSRPISARCTLFNCGSEPAREGGLTADQFLPDVLVPTVGASLLAKAA